MIVHLVKEYNLQVGPNNLCRQGKGESATQLPFS
jgi:hypothetical protein